MHACILVRKICGKSTKKPRRFSNRSHPIFGAGPYRRISSNEHRRPQPDGSELGYTLTDWLDVKVRVQNGLYSGPIDNNKSKTGMIAFGIKPADKMWLSLIGFVGRDELTPLSTHVYGGSLLGGYQLNDKWHIGTELDYFNFRSTAKDSPVYSLGAWLSYALTKTLSPAVRLDFVSDAKGVDAIAGGVSPAYGYLNGAGTGQDITSVALTLNWKPAPNIKIQPEVRFDHTSLKNGFGTKQDRVILGAGVSYLF